MNLSQIRFPLYKLRAYLSIDTNPLGLVKITSVKGTYILDDKSIEGGFEERRSKIQGTLYKLKERVLYLRQLVKYKSGTTFIDSDGNIIKYRKSSKMFEVVSKKISRIRPYGNWSVIYLEQDEQSYIVGHTVLPTTTHASIMKTSWGNLLYDLTTKYHEPYKRKI